MKFLLKAKNPILFDRYETCYGVCTDTITSINLIIVDDRNIPLAPCDGGFKCKSNESECEKNNCCKNTNYYKQKKYRNNENYTKNNFIEEPGFRANVLEIIKLFNTCIGKYWSKKTLVQYNTNLEKAPYPIEYVPFSPSTENIAIYVYEKMKPIIKDQLHAKLVDIQIETINSTLNLADDY